MANDMPTIYHSKHWVGSTIFVACYILLLGIISFKSFVPMLYLSPWGRPIVLVCHKLVSSVCNVDHTVVYCRKALKVCGDAQSAVAKERAIYEMFVEGHVITPLHTLVEVRF